MFSYKESKDVKGGSFLAHYMTAKQDKQANTKRCKSFIFIGLLSHLSQSFLSPFPLAKVSINLRFNDSEPGGVGNRSWKWARKVMPCGRRVRDPCEPFVSFSVPSPFAAIDL